MRSPRYVEGPPSRRLESAQPSTAGEGPLCLSTGCTVGAGPAGRTLGHRGGPGSARAQTLISAGPWLATSGERKATQGRGSTETAGPWAVTADGYWLSARAMTPGETGRWGWVSWARRAGAAPTPETSVTDARGLAPEGPCRRSPLLAWTARGGSTGERQAGPARPPQNPPHASRPFTHPRGPCPHLLPYIIWVRREDRVIAPGEGTAGAFP